MKMMAVGLGKRNGAEVCHSTGFRLMHTIMPSVAEGILKSGKILLGFAIIENFSAAHPAGRTWLIGASEKTDGAVISS